MSSECYGFICEWCARGRAFDSRRVPRPGREREVGARRSHTRRHARRRYDPSPQIKRRYLLKYFPVEHQIEMIDLKLKRGFLKRGPAPADVMPSQFYVGGQVIIHSRALSIIDYADPFTRSKLAPASECAALIISPDAYHHSGKILDELSTAGFALKNLKMLRLSEGEADELTGMLGVGEPSAPYAKLLCSGPVVAVGLMAPGSLEKLAQCIGDLKARYATDDVEQALACAPSAPANDAVLSFAFERAHMPTATLEEGAVSCCVVRPHAVHAGHTGAVLDAIMDAGYDVSALEIFRLDEAAAKEFLEVYQGVVPEYNDMVLEMCTGPCVALEVRAENAVMTFRETAGPWDVEMAKELRPKTLRAKFGVDRVHNGVHCTDLPEDGALECAYFFDLLQT